jgi:hypothetical protein
MMVRSLLRLLTRIGLGVVIGLSLFALYLVASLPVDKKLSLLEPDQREALIYAIALSCAAGAFIGLCWGICNWGLQPVNGEEESPVNSIGG